MRRYFLIALAFAGVLAALLGVALAENYSGTTKKGTPGTPHIVGTGDRPDEQTAAFRSAIAVADTRTTAGILATDQFLLKGPRTIIVSPRFSASGANCKIRIAYVNKTSNDPTLENDHPNLSSTDTDVNKIKGWSDERTVTGDTNQYEGAYYPAPDEYFDGEGAIAVRVIVTTAPSSGTVTFWVGSK